jgi:ATP-dependent Clp protease ATP-binding subunit ClpC
MSDMPFRSFFGGDPFRGFEELTGRVFGGMEGWPGLLQMLDDGRLTDGQGRTVDFTNTIVIMTSNIGAQIILEATGDVEEQLMDLLLERTRQRLRGQDVTLEVTDAARDWLAGRGYQPEFGARPLRRTVQRELDNRLATMLLTGEVGEHGKVTVDVADDQLRLHAHNPEPAT